MSNAPKRIWLQWNPIVPQESTWCADRIDEGDDPDVEYVRADLIERQRAVIEAARNLVDALANWDQYYPADVADSLVDLSYALHALDGGGDE